MSNACQQALVPWFRPHQIARYHSQHSSILSTVNVLNHVCADQGRATCFSGLARVFKPVYLVDSQVSAVMRADHPLARKREPGLRDSLDAPHIAPSSSYGVRHLHDFAARKRSRRVAPVFETERFELICRHVIHEQVIGFNVPICVSGLDDPRLVLRPISKRDLPPGSLILGQMRGRTLPVPSARFAIQLDAAVEGSEQHGDAGPMQPALPKRYLKKSHPSDARARESGRISPWSLHCHRYAPSASVQVDEAKSCCSRGVGLYALRAYLRCMENRPQTSVLYNANCPVCNFEIGHYARYAHKANLPIRFDDLNTTARAEWGLDADTAARRLYVLHNGMLTSGIPAFLVLWAQMPRYRLLGQIVGLPGIRQIASAGYDYVLAPLIYRWHLRRLRKQRASA